MKLINTVLQDIALCHSKIVPWSHKLGTFLTKYRVLMSPRNPETAPLLGYPVFFHHRIEYGYFLKTLRDSERFLARLSDVRTVVDIGANLGYFSIICAYAFPEAEITAFEPMPQIYTLLVRNVSPYARVKTENLAIYDRETTIAMEYSEATPDQSKIRSFGGGTSVRATTLDNYLRESSLDLLKIDVEGFENFVLAGANGTLTKTRYVFTEITPGPNYTLEEIESSLHEAGFNLLDQDIKGHYRNALFENRNLAMC